MRSTIVFFVILLLGVTLSAQNINTAFSGKISVGDDNTTPQNGSIRYNANSLKFEGFIEGKWIDLSSPCVCPYVLSPFTSTIDFVSVSTINNKVQITIRFSHVMDTSSFIYGTNLIVQGSSLSAGGTLTWSEGNTRLRIETNESFNALVNECSNGFLLTIKGVGSNSVRGINTMTIDGDRDGCCGGDYIIRLGIIC